MERKIGEIFEYDGEWCQCVEDTEYISCINCCFYNGGHKLCTDKDIGNCVGEYRSDAKSICFKKLEKVGEPYDDCGTILQRFKIYTNVTNADTKGLELHIYSNNTIGIEIKQNKEDMEEKKLNLKPFDLQKAKTGKPVCTRDGRKARIICFDRNDLYPIVALIECEDGKEIIGAYSKEGQTEIYEIKGTNLMMLPEKKEGWVNVYYNRIDGITFSKYPYPSKEEAIKNVGTMSNRIDTVKISWEE